MKSSAYLDLLDAPRVGSGYLAPRICSTFNSFVALKRSASIPDVLAFEIEGVASRNRSGDPLYIDNTAHPANRRLALARAKETHVTGFGLDLNLVGKGNNGHYAPFAWTA